MSQSNSGIGDRIGRLIHELRMNNNSFSVKIGLSNSATISRIIKEEREPSYKVLSKIITTFPEVNTRWLLIGEGDMLLSNSGDIVNPTEYSELKNKLDDQTQKYVTLLEDHNKLLSYIKDNVLKDMP